MPVRHPQLLLVAALLLAGIIWASGCGDAATEPTPPPPDPPRPTTATVTPGTAQLTALGATVQLAAEVLDQNGQVMSGTPVSWSSSDASVAIVDASGLVTAAANGSATITATAGSVSGTAAVTVAQAVSAVAVSPAADTLVAFGDTVRLAAETTDANGHNVAGSEFSWSSSDTLVATVDGSGLVESLAEGEAVVTATVSGVTGDAKLTVVPPLPAAVAVSPDSVRFTALGQTAALAVEVREQAGRVMAEVAVSWSSGDTLVAAVDPAGLLTAVGDGTTTVTATASNVSDAVVATVMQSVGSVAVSPAEGRIGVGDTLRLRAEAFDENGHPVDGATFSWSSSAAGVAKVDDAGLVEGVAEGAVRITATAGDASGVAEVTVENPDRAALVALYNSTDGANWINSQNWLTNAPLREWYGIGMNEHDRVVEVSLQRNNLTGQIPSELGRLVNLNRLLLWDNALEGQLPAELAGLRNLAWLELSHNALTGTIPPQFGQLANLERLLLQANDLTGLVPPELGTLTNLRVFVIDDNDLTGLIPATFLQLDNLEWFVFGDTRGLCAPGTGDFVSWSHRIENFRGPFCNSADVAVLQSLYNATGGASWMESGGWLGDAAVGNWYGVDTDSIGRVTGLDLSRNGLSGQLPEELGRLSRMTHLRIGGNALSGALPKSLADLPLRELHYADTQLCTPPRESFRAWLSSIPSHEGTDEECAPLSDRDILEIFYHATDGPNWLNSDNWLSDAPLRQWHGVYTDAAGRVVGLILLSNRLAGPIPPEIGDLSRLDVLRLPSNALTGSIPPELGSLSELTDLNLYFNRLSGMIPSELGKLSKLTDLDLSLNRRLSGMIPSELGSLSELHTLDLSRTGLSGAIPSELGNLSGLESLDLSQTRLSGPIPSEFGNLSSLTELAIESSGLTGAIPREFGSLSRLRRLRLYDNSLSGPIPSEIGELSALTEIHLGANGLSGSIPPELGYLSRLTEVNLQDNQLIGSVPSELGRLASLRVLHLAQNDGMSGALPSSLTALRSLEVLMLVATGLCAPSDPAFLAWLAGVENSRVRACDGGESAMAYLTQAVQSREFPVPLVAGETALLRVFVTAPQTTTQGIPPVRAKFYMDGAETYIVDIPAKSLSIPTEIDEGLLSKSANAEIPGEFVQPGLEMVIEIDPDGTLASELGVSKRIPKTGRATVDVQDMPTFSLTLVPFLWNAAPDSSGLDVTRGLAQEDEVFWMTRTLLPVGEFDLAIHEPVLTSTNAVSELLDATEAIRVMEGADGHYVGTIAGDYVGPRGFGRISSRVAFVVLPLGDADYVFAHELGHTMSLAHPPCGGAGHPDPGFPYSNGATGAWGWDFRDGGSLVAPHNRDLMSYCGSGIWWISDYHFTKALRYRLDDEATSSPTAPARSLLLWGGAEANGQLFLNPAFVVDAPTALPSSNGAYRLTGRNVNGGELFSLHFDMLQSADGDSGSSFAFALPAQRGWEGYLESITLSGPGGSVTLDTDSNLPMAILRNPRNGQVRGILRDPPASFLTEAAAAGSLSPAVEVLFSRGIPETGAWRR